VRLFSRASSESSHPSETGRSLSEAFLNTSSVRDTLPEQYRTHFDELRSGILTFCHEFKIPVETLRSKEAFGLELTSKRIPTERMREVVSLFARLEYLVTNREPFKEIPSEYLEEAERLYHLREQYTSQVTLLEQAGILKDGAIIGIDGNKYPIPTLEQIATRLFERESELSTKRDQGFTKLLLVPFGMSLDVLREVLRQFLLSYKIDHPDFDLDTDDPLWAWKGYEEADIGNPLRIMYHPKSFDGNHRGQTKRQILETQAEHPEDSFPGWRIHLFQALQDNTLGFCGIPRQGQGKTQGKEIPRPDLETNKTLIQYLFTLQKAQEDPNSPYHNESGLTPEDWILAFMTHLTEIGQPLDDYGNSKESITYLTGVCFSSFSSDRLPCAYWDYNGRRAALGRIDPDSLDDHDFIGIRSSVIV